MESENDIVGVVNRRNASLFKKGLSEDGDGTKFEPYPKPYPA